MRTEETLSSTCAKSNDVNAGGRKTIEEDVAVIVDVKSDDVLFSEEVESVVPSLESESEEESEDEWESDDDEEMDDDDEDAELDEGLAERLRILADARALKNLATAFLHPEKSVMTTDGAAFGRNYFDRPSAPERLEDEDADEVAEILEDAMKLKKAARAYLHPEDPVKVEDVTAFGRNYFERASAPEVEEVEVANERARVLADAKALKKAAVDFMHPEIGVSSVDGACFGRNFYNRPSAPETEEDEFADERAEILADALALKKAAVDYLHPEVGVVNSDGAAFGRNYFNRPSAPETESVEEANERAQILADAQALKKSAMNYLHPEVGVTVEDSTVFGRNYFSRYSAPETEEDEFADERAEILADALALKKAALDYLHPEVGVVASDGAAFGRNYFNRPSAPETESVEEANERAQILADAQALKKSAMNYLHPEVGVTVEDSTVFGRNYFSRYSAPETEEDEFADERAEILADALALKKAAMDYLHPEVGVVTSNGAAFGRNYFERASAPETESVEEANERAQILADAQALKKSAMNYLHPEVGVTCTDGACFGRNYFTRPSAPTAEVEPKKMSPEQDITGDLSKLAAAVKGANLPSTKSVKLNSMDNDLGPAKKSASNVNLFGLSEEVM
jgi:adenosyl cobinamide kinase/adenosyl cobinamide phosphate guanylyltransferase